MQSLTWIALHILAFLSDVVERKALEPCDLKKCKTAVKELKLIRDRCKASAPPPVAAVKRGQSSVLASISSCVKSSTSPAANATASSSKVAPKRSASLTKIMKSAAKSAKIATTKVTTAISSKLQKTKTTTTSSDVTASLALMAASLASQAATTCSSDATRLLQPSCFPVANQGTSNFQSSAPSTASVYVFRGSGATTNASGATKNASGATKNVPAAKTGKKKKKKKKNNVVAAAASQVQQLQAKTATPPNPSCDVTAPAMKPPAANDSKQKPSASAAHSPSRMTVKPAADDVIVISDQSSCALGGASAIVISDTSTCSSSNDVQVCFPPQLEVSQNIRPLFFSIPPHTLPHHLL